MNVIQWCGKMLLRTPTSIVHCGATYLEECVMLEVNIILGVHILLMEQLRSDGGNLLWGM